MKQVNILESYILLNNHNFIAKKQNSDLKWNLVTI